MPFWYLWRMRRRSLGDESDVGFREDLSNAIPFSLTITVEGRHGDGFDVVIATTSVRRNGSHKPNARPFGLDGFGVRHHLIGELNESPVTTTAIFSARFA